MSERDSSEQEEEETEEVSSCSQDKQQGNGLLSVASVICLNTDGSPSFPWLLMVHSTQVLFGQKAKEAIAGIVALHGVDKCIELAIMLKRFTWGKSLEVRTLWTHASLLHSDTVMELVMATGLGYNVLAEVSNCMSNLSTSPHLAMTLSYHLLILLLVFIPPSGRQGAQPMMNGDIARKISSAIRFLE